MFHIESFLLLLHQRFKERANFTLIKFQPLQSNASCFLTGVNNGLILLQDKRIPGHYVESVIDITDVQSVIMVYGVSCGTVESYNALIGRLLVM